MKNWQPNLKEFNDVFANEYCLKILTILSQNKEKMCTADIARLLEVHDSTAKRYLSSLVNNNLINQETALNFQGSPNFYYFNESKIIINLDFEYLNKMINKNQIWSKFADLKIRELPNLSSNIVYNQNKQGMIHSITYKKRTRARRTITYHIKLNEDEMRFMKHLPYPTQAYEKFITICTKAQITNFYSIKKLLFFVKKIEKLGIIEVKNLDDK